MTTKQLLRDKYLELIISKFNYVDTNEKFNKKLFNTIENNVNFILEGMENID